MNTANVPAKDQVASAGAAAMPPTLAVNPQSLQHAPIRGREYRPQRPVFSDEETEVDFYARTPFTAWEHALLRKRHHPKLWQAVLGSPYERLYRRRFRLA